MTSIFQAQFDFLIVLNFEGLYFFNSHVFQSQNCHFSGKISNFYEFILFMIFLSHNSKNGYFDETFKNHKVYKTNS